MKSQSEVEQRRNEPLCQIVCTDHKTCRTIAERPLLGRWLCCEHYEAVIKELSGRGVLDSFARNSSKDLPIHKCELHRVECDRYIEHHPRNAARIRFHVDDDGELRVYLLCLSCAELYDSDVEQFKFECFEDEREQ
jgi:hypothetical protein